MNTEQEENLLDALTELNLIREENEKLKAALATARETLDWAEAILCNAQPIGHCTQQEWDKIVHKWRDQKHAARAQEGPSHD